MIWNIPTPHPVPAIKPPRWDLWWRISLAVGAFVLFIAALGWFWLEDGRIWLYSFGVVVAWGLLCALTVGWMMYRYGVDLEHVEGLHLYNSLQEAEWQRWSQKGLPVLDYSFILPPSVPFVTLTPQQVVSEMAYSPGVRPGPLTLLRELLLPLLPALREVVRYHPLTVSLPESVGVRDFHQFCEEVGFPLTYISVTQTDSRNIFSSLFQWSDSKDIALCRLVVLSDWEDNRHYTQGAVAWLMGPVENKFSLPVRTTLHRPMQGKDGGTADDIRQFLYYQTLAQQASDLWLSAGASALATPMMIQRAACLKTVSDSVPSPELTQHYLPHWLGKVSEESPFFAVTLMMQMAECRKGTQVLLHKEKNALTFCSISAGAFSHE
ncbi:TPA: hypothetical protein JD264_09725 [Serratia fonticola]|nr:hypothetical protein [Serratia fonticola]